MKKILLLSLIAGLSVNAIAQIRIAPEVGFNIASASVDQPATLGLPSLDTKPVMGIKAGAIVEVPVSSHFYLQPGIFYAMKGFKESGSASYSVLFYTVNIDVEGKERSNYLEVPVNVLYKFGTPGGGRIFVGAGPYLGYALGGKYDYSISAGGFADTSASESLRVGTDSNDHIKPFDFGANINAGYELGMGLFARAQFSYGFLNVMPYTGASQKNWGITVSVGYLIGLNRGAKKE